MVFINILIFIFGIVILFKGSDMLIESASSIAKRFGVSEFVIGLTIVAIGTSVPELASSVIAALNHDPGIIIGNVIGSNIANIGLIVGIASTVAVIKTRREMIERDGYIMLFVSFALLFFLINKRLSIIECIIFLVLYLAYLLFLLEEKPERKGKYHFREYLRYVYKFNYLLTIRSRIIRGVKGYRKKEKQEAKKTFAKGLFKNFFEMILGFAGVFFGAKFIVENAIFFANMLNIPSNLIGISLVALGTSLPELSVCISSARKGFGNIAVGNVIGSNIANILLILGISGLITPITISPQTLLFSIPFMILMSILLLVFIRSYWQIRKIEGIVFLILYILFIVLMFSNIIPI